MEFRSLIEEKLNWKIGEKTEKMGACAPTFYVFLVSGNCVCIKEYII